MFPKTENELFDRMQNLKAKNANWLDDLETVSRKDSLADKICFDFVEFFEIDNVLCWRPLTGILNWGYSLV